jgi:hypothetical protein
MQVADPAVDSADGAEVDTQFLQHLHDLGVKLLNCLEIPLAAFERRTAETVADAGPNPA